ncbi:hypothetical protein NQZ68_019305 [Dissostichus eleginoides]|nr:hypothetical protein NQZ68_019305 [Dissostichus eleginoides]
MDKRGAQRDKMEGRETERGNVAPRVSGESGRGGPGPRGSQRASCERRVPPARCCPSLPSLLEDGILHGPLLTALNPP